MRNFSITGKCRIGAGYYGITIQPGSNIVACTYDGGSTEVMTGVYSTGVPGVGMRLRKSGGAPVTGGGGQKCYTPLATIGSDGSYAFTGSLELVRTTGALPTPPTSLPGGPTGMGAWAFGVYNTYVVLNADRGMIWDGSSSIYPVGDIVLKPITCAITPPPGSTVTLPTIMAAQLPTPGATAGSTRFNIGLRCDSDATVGITLDAAPGFNVVGASSNGILSAQTGAGKAGGVGIQIFDAGNTTPMPMQVRNSLPGVMINNQTSYPFWARYVRLGPVSGGDVNSAMIFTFDYR